MGRTSWWVAMAWLSLAIPGLHAATLDAAPSGNDVVFTWDTAGPDTILRGTQPDNMVPWLVNVTSPVTAPGENLLRGEDAFYELASGSNRAWRIEQTIASDQPGYPFTTECLSLPERRSYAAVDLFALWPDLRELEWWDPGRQARMELARFGSDVVGDAAPLPRHGGVRAAFLGPTAITIVGSRDDGYAGPDSGDLESGPPPFPPSTIVGFPPDARYPTLYQVLCGRRDVDWFDRDADGYPDDCGPDLDADGFADTGLWRAPTPPVSSRSAVRVGMDAAADDTFPSVLGHIALGRYIFEGSERTIPPGAALFLGSNAPADYNFPFRPPVR